ncbi:nuclear transport factor 2 family protein [Acidobacteria bacterium ACD]|nr:MAG: nuclear transport factor 2 family protein [Acidobacteriota bacterium]MDL1950899.1 nuclear transport factor 2 family protein [Acidobacteria bacterium ACD]
MPTQTELESLATRFLDAWTSQDVEAVLACYTDDLVYRDPNTRGDVVGAEAMRRYLTKLFAAWRMTWRLREAHPFATGEGAAILWRATFQKAGSDAVVEADGMDLICLDGRRARRNEVYFDRTVLASL